MTTSRQIEIFSAGCPLCEDVISLVNRLACPSCEIRISDTHNAAVGERARTLGIVHVPSVVVDGTVLAAESTSVLDEACLRAAGVGRAI